MISIHNLSKSYGRKMVLKNIILDFNTGEVHGIVGNNGAGKSSLFWCIAGIENHEGSVNSDHENIKDHLGFLQTDPYFFSKITGREYIQLLCIARRVVAHNFDGKNIIDLPLDEYAVNYSAGMKKKLAITGILCQENDYFIFDEPFNGLDLQSSIIVTAIIHRLKALKKIVLISSHIFSTLSECCDQIHLLKDGAVERSTNKEDFNIIEEEMKMLTLGNKIEMLNLK